MDGKNWQKIKEVFYSALNRRESDRGAYLDEACWGDAELRGEVELLLSSYESDYLEDAILPLDEDIAAFRPPFLAPGDEFSHYRIVRLIGRGGMGEVYLANDTTLDRLVAVKVVHEGSGLGEMAGRRLLREARSAARLDHPNICSVFEVGEAAGRPFIAMQYVEGETLEKLIRNDPPTPQESIQIVIQIAHALSEAHKCGIVHRDIKPSNIILDVRGQVKVLDFGLAKRVLIEAGGHTVSMLTEIGTIAGTVVYMSPEQARGFEIDSRSDIWSLGVVFFELLTQRHPFAGATKSDIIASILQKSVPSLSNFYNNYPVEADNIITRALQKDIDARFASASDFARDVGKLATENSQVDWIRGRPTDDGSRVAFSSDWSFLPTTGEVGNDTSPITAQTTAETAVRPSPNTAIRILASTTSIVSLWILAILSVAMVGWRYYAARDQQITFAKEMHKKLAVAPLFPSDKRPEGAVANPSYSPDGRFIAYSLMNDGSSAIYVKNIEAGEPVKISDGQSYDRTPVWSPDGLRLTFLSVRGGKDGLWTISYLGGTPVFQVAIEGGGGQHALKKWAKDAERIFSEFRGQLKLIDLNNGKVSDTEFNFQEGAKQIEISPDETKAAYVLGNGAIDEVWIAVLNSADPRRITNAGVRGFGPSWFPDSNEFAYCQDISGRLQVVVYNVGLNIVDQITFNEFNSRTPMVSTDGGHVRYLAWDRFEND